MVDSDGELETYLRAFPAQAEVLRVMRAVRRWQETVLSACGRLTNIDQNDAEGKLGRGQPILAGERLVLDEALFREATGRLPELFPISWPLRSETEILLESILDATGTSSNLAAGYLADKSGVLQELAASAGAEPATVAFVLETTLGPFFERTARALNLGPEVLAWGHGICPVCGSPPLLGRLDLGTGKRWLSCHLCRTEWAFPRIKCAFCEESRPDRLVCLHSDDVPGRRVDACDTCKRYVKTVDERVVGQAVSILLEDVITGRLDVIAMGHGYS